MDAFSRGQICHAGRVLVLGSGTRAFLAVIRSLGRAGLRVHTGMCPADDVALRSHYVARHHRIPPFVPGEGDWEEAMTRVLRDQRFDLVIPCSDASLIPLQLHRERLSRLARLYTLDDNAYRLAFDKIASSRLAASLGMPVAAEKVVSTDMPIEAMLDGLSPPVVIKPPSSFVPEQLTSKRRVMRARTREQFAACMAAARPWGTALIQENFAGRGVGVELLGDRGDVLVAFQHLRVHEPLEGGGSSYRVSMPLARPLLRASRRMMEALNYTGVAMMEFKWNPDTDDWVFIEINGRFWGSLPLAVAAGADFPRYLYELLVQGVRRFPSGYRKGLYCRNLALDVEWMRANLRADRSDPTLATRPLWRVALELGSLLTLNERSDTLQVDDLAPGLAEIGAKGRGLARRVGLAWRYGLPRCGPVRGLLGCGARSAVRRARTVLFVCKGNICRSPFAERYTRQMAGPSLQVASSGYYPQGGRCSPEAALEAAKGFGVDLASHRSTVLNQDMIDAADVVLFFDEAIRVRLLQDFPSARRRLFCLGMQLPQGPLRIEDPYGKDVAAFAHAYERIALAIDRLFGAGQVLNRQDGRGA